ncbi:DUF7164 domain-containing protein [Paraburkholderia kururiensis]|uniref:DUF7164 domain-containing protein n=1 Tax=Paraburkholderia kururiensis TaxID=984307 RepID=A0ABZ0WLA4_9BURK|nr:hypothetical protein [Paraburkholderia kururiensis]WQD78152.1 hypothetical protein U0042_00040 [Paraburkholderia kururiensis]
MDLGILVYVDNNSNNIEEFQWLYKSILHTGLFSRATIIAVCHPEAITALPKDEHIVIVPSEPFADKNREWQGYKFINSVANLCEQSALDACAPFKYILKTDCDTFVTPALVTFRPTGLCFGFGGYAYEESVRRKLSECSARWGFPHAGLHNVGASLLGPSGMVANFLMAQMDFCNKLLREEFSHFHGEWPGWCKNVLTMYAGELSLRRTYPQQCSIGLLDHFPYASRSLGSDILHIHAWHTDQYWSKSQYRAGQYNHMKLDDIDMNTLGGYCHWLAAADIDCVRLGASENR